ncbi:MAG: phosphoribosylanthranilate isomerase, partial [Flavobacteriaceae bacterium]|nr:phosphoribosylanthranilate isomerase [Flavobacteriaceae bacterium]
MKIKVCGMRDSDNIQELVKLSPDYIGFIFYDKSKRFVSEFPKVEIPSRIKKVGVFVNEEIENIIDIANHYDLDLIQLHGDEDISFVNQLS